MKRLMILILVGTLLLPMAGCIQAILIGGAAAAGMISNELGKAEKEKTEELAKERKQEKKETTKKAVDETTLKELDELF